MNLTRQIHRSGRAVASGESVTLAKARRSLRSLANPRKALVYRGFFKETNDIFLGVTTPQIRSLSRQYETLPLRAVRQLMNSCVHDERALANAILVRKFRAGNSHQQKCVFDFYIRNRPYIRSWDGVDDSAPYIVGPYLLNRDKKVLHGLARSKNLWDRRIAIVATWWFIRHGEIDTTLKVARTLMTDNEDLIHKATGWMLREVGKRDLPALKRFLRAHAHKMPRTTLRYAIEGLSPEQRLAWLQKKRAKKNPRRI